MSGDFSIGSNTWPGIGKLIIGSRGETAHWDGTQLDRRLESELGDLLAAITFVIRENGLNDAALAFARSVRAGREG